jgi:hypothetical protein
MRGRDLERLLEQADELVELRSRLRRIRAIEDELAHDEEIERLAPEVARAAECRLPQIDRVTRSLEEQWVAQGPLVSLWQRAVELAELAESSGADGAPYRQDADAARRRVESARLETRDHLADLVAEREALMDIALAAPFELPAAEAIRDDVRPEAARRDALALADFARELARLSGEAYAEAAERIAAARRELDELGGADDATRRIAELEAELPARIDLPRSAPPSAVRRLERAGLPVDHPAAV